MPKIVFTDHEGAVRSVDADAGITLMEAARNNDIPGIVAECGGMCACATCHVYLGADWFDRVGPIGADEEPMLEFIEDRRATSRLACQIELTTDLDGLEVETPADQG